MEDFNPIGGSWQQDSAYSLRQLINQAENIIKAIDNTSTTVEVVTNVYEKADTIFVYNPLPIITPAPKQNIVVVKNYIKPDPIVIDVNKRNAYGRVCGTWASSNSKDIKCFECVDKWLADNKGGFELKELTASGTGCKIK